MNGTKQKMAGKQKMAENDKNGGAYLAWEWVCVSARYFLFQHCRRHLGFLYQASEEPKYNLKKSHRVQTVQITGCKEYTSQRVQITSGGVVDGPGSLG